MHRLVDSVKVLPSARCSTFILCCRSYSKRRKYPPDPSIAEALPVDEFPVREENSTSVHVWGRADHGGLGAYLQKKSKMENRKDERFKQFNRPLRLTFAEKHNVKDIAAGYGFSLFVVENKDSDVVFGTGINTDSQIGVHDPRRGAPLEVLLSPVPITLPAAKKLRVKSISAGRAHTVVISDEGKLFSFGNNAYGQCGRAIITEEKYSGNRIIHMVADFDDEPAKMVECGQDHTLVVTDSGRVFGCGWGADGQTGQGHYNSCEKFSLIGGDIKGEPILKVSSKADCVLAINDSGDVFGWGNSEYSQLLGQDDPRQQINVPIVLKKCKGFGKIIDVAAAGSYCLMLNDEGDVFSWGYGILGQGPVAQQSWLPRLIPPTLFGRNEFQPHTRVVSIYAGLSFSAAITNTGNLYTWGKNRSSCLGLGDDKDQFFPFRVSLGLSAIKLSLGVDHAVCLTRS